MRDKLSPLPKTFKGIALFTPGGDLIYGVDANHLTQWHIHLCHGLQKIMGLGDSPHFLVPGYTATIERRLDPQTQQLKTIAEVYPAVKRYIPLLELLFELEPNTDWQVATWQEEYCNHAVIETYKHKFPQLWTQQNLLVRLDPESAIKKAAESHSPGAFVENESTAPPEGYMLRLFISSEDSGAEKTLGHVHQLLEEELANPYTLKVIDVAQHPEQAAHHHIITTPTLIRVSPKPTRRIVGQLDDIPRLLSIIIGA